MTAVIALIPCAAHAERGIAFDPFPNVIAAGVGRTTEWVGARDTVTAIAPIVRLTLEQSRSITLYGSSLYYSFSDDPGWQGGLLGYYRFGREDVSDPVVNQLTPISGTVEGGFSIGYQWRWTSSGYAATSIGVDVTTDLGGVYGGAVVVPWARIWFPVSWLGQIGIGLGTSYVSASFMSTYFGVSGADAQRTGLSAYAPGADRKDAYAWTAIMWPLPKKWALGAGVYYQRLLDGAADSPIVRERGDPNQWTVGIGAGRFW